MNHTRPKRWRASLAIHALALLSASVGCSKTDPSQLSEWTPADHTNQAPQETGQVDTKKKRAGFERMEANGINDVTLATWKQNCVRCHGVVGRGDGPESRVVRPPDFTQSKWQQNATDVALRETIRKGRGKMPSFAHLPEATVTSLVSLIRMLNPGARPSSDASPSPGPEGQKPRDEPTAVKTPPLENPGDATPKKQGAAEPTTP